MIDRCKAKCKPSRTSILLVVNLKANLSIVRSIKSTMVYKYKRYANNLVQNVKTVYKFLELVDMSFVFEKFYLYFENNLIHFD